ncbi:carotenoid ester lipase [Macrolepiota fuliginosa MF-IS2]|uniref:Carboxylic ester hydrolase n=1 Tax=Macrolepiota fuliginosa MF-IS2 TaxID=1400762 RepID=A0A9P5XFU2_9AGAR|nr:carotenoid ester lipase [Macrolepiota fuliginosa MF-IS2]
MFFQLLATLVFSTVLIAAAPAASTVQLDGATVTGTSVGSVQQFLGIPFAQPPIGDLRFRLPQPVPAYNRSFSTTAFGPSCPQQKFVLPVLKGLPQVIVDDLINKVYSAVIPSSEDCLTINVVKPASATPSSKLPVLFWIYGGGFEFGGASTYDGSGIVARSISMGSPVIFVSINHRRVTGFGFLASKEVKNAGVGNLGLQDQRQALRWVQKYITAFGGDPTKVTIWGESSGAISVSLHMLANGGNTEGLFRAGVMQSGAPIPVGDIENGQVYYDSIVADTGCSGSADTLQCLRTAPYDTLKAAIDKTPSITSYQSLRLAWLPRADSVFLTDHPQRLVQQGKIARVLFITGKSCNCDDEGTIFSFSTLNETTESEMRDYVKNVALFGITDAQIDQLATLYPANLNQGSPFDTGPLNSLTPQFKRIAAVQGDGVFQAPRRWFLKNTSGKQDIWVYRDKRFKFLPFVGSMHGSDLVDSFFLGQELRDYIIRFTVKLDPSGTGFFDFKWPKYTTGNPNQLIFLDGLVPQIVRKDTYRQPQMDFLTQLGLQAPV